MSHRKSILTLLLALLLLTTCDSGSGPSSTGLLQLVVANMRGLKTYHLAIPSLALPALNFLAAGSDPNFDIALYGSAPPSRPA